MTTESAMIEDCPSGSNLLTLKYEYTPNRLMAWLGFQPKTWRFQYLGDCTIWYYYPEMLRCDLVTENHLCDWWQRLKGIKIRDYEEQ